MRQGKDKKTTTIIVLAIISILLIGYIGFNKYQEYNEEKNLSVFQQGFQYAIIQVAQQAATCQQVPLQIQDQTINIIAVDCLRQ